MKLANLPNPKTAPLPEAYSRARAALAECSRVDECKTWADKMQALASYARQADDDELHKMAIRIQARAVRRCGELLAEFQTGSLGGRPPKNGGGAPTVSQRQAAASAGMSKDQEVQARRLANVPEAAFEAMVDSEDPPTVTALADLGTKATAQKRPGFTDAIYLRGALHRLHEKTSEFTPAYIVGGMDSWEYDEARALSRAVRAWLEDFEEALA